MAQAEMDLAAEVAVAAIKDKLDKMSALELVAWLSEHKQAAGWKRLAKGIVAFVYPQGNLAEGLEKLGLTTEQIEKVTAAAR